MRNPNTPVICRLCSDEKLVAELSRSIDGYLTDVCLVCRQRELQVILTQVAAILEPQTQIDQSTIRTDNENTQEVDLKVLSCGHASTCWCPICHYCEDV